MKDKLKAKIQEVADQAIRMVETFSDDGNDYYNNIHFTLYLDKDYAVTLRIEDAEKKSADFIPLSEIEDK